MRLPAALALALAAAPLAGCFEYGTAGSVFGPAADPPRGDAGPSWAISIKAKPAQGAAPLLASVAIQADGAPADVPWSVDFGDRSPLVRGHGPVGAAEHRFTAPGRYDVLITVGAGDEARQSVLTIRVLPPGVVVEKPDEEVEATPVPAPAGGGRSPGRSPGGSSSSTGTTSAPSSNGTDSSSSSSGTGGPTFAPKDPDKDKKGKDGNTSSSSSASPSTSSSSSTTASTSQSPTPSPTATASSSSSPSASPSPTPDPTPTETASPTPTPTQTPTPTPTSTATESPSPSPTASGSPSPTPAPEPTSNFAPNATLTAAQDSTTAPANVTYGISVEDPDGDPVSWELAVDGVVLGSGTEADSPWSITQAYDSPGDHDAVLTASDGTDTVQARLTVSIAAA